MHDFTLDVLPGDGDGLGNCMQTKLTADSNVSGDTNVSTIKTDAMLIKPTPIDTDTKPSPSLHAACTTAAPTALSPPGPHLALLHLPSLRLGRTRRSSTSH